MDAWFTTALDIEECLAGSVVVADVVKSFETVGRAILNLFLSSLGLPAWFRHAYFQYHAKVRLCFKLAAGVGELWSRDGGIPQVRSQSNSFGGDLWSARRVSQLKPGPREAMRSNPSRRHEAKSRWDNGLNVHDLHTPRRTSAHMLCPGPSEGRNRSFGQEGSKTHRS